MTQPTGLLTTGMEIAADLHATALQDFAAAQAPESPVRDLLNPKLLAWTRDRLKAGKPIDLYAALDAARIDSAAKAHANARLIAERDAALTAVRDLNAERANLLRLRVGKAVYLLDDRDAAISADLNSGAWRGALTFGVYSAIGDLAALVNALEVLVKQGFGGRVVGTPMSVQGVKVKRQTPSEADRACAVLTVEYLSARSRVIGAAHTIDGGFEIAEAKL